MEIILINIIMYLGTYAIISPCVFSFCVKQKVFLQQKSLLPFFKKWK